jgi:hypothetical protein
VLCPPLTPLLRLLGAFFIAALCYPPHLALIEAISTGLHSRNRILLMTVHADSVSSIPPVLFFLGLPLALLGLLAPHGL